MSVEQPQYQVVREGPGWQLRQYAPGLVVETQVSGGRSVSGREAFGRLAGYIFGGNQRRQSFAMTAPVTQASEGDDRWTVRFFLPSGVDLRNAPPPADPRVRVHPLSQRLVAVRRFAGEGAEQRFAHEAGLLWAALQQAGLKPVGAPTWARYDPPWVPTPLQTHEVHWSVE